MLSLNIRFTAGYKLDGLIANITYSTYLIEEPATLIVKRILIPMEKDQSSPH